MLPPEVEIIRAIQSVFDGPWGKLFVVFCARYAIFLFGFFVATFDRKRPLHHIAREALWSALIAFLMAEVLSKIFMRERPFLAWKEIQLLIPPPLGDSFPSRHASISFALASALLYGRRTWGIAAVGLAVLVAFGRVASGAHYPTDVLAGAVIGLGSFLIVRWFHHQLQKTKPSTPA